MRISSFFITLFFTVSSFVSYAQDSSFPKKQELKIESLPISLEEEEDAMILERHQAKYLKGQEELQRELVQLESGQQAVEEQLFYLQNQQQQSKGGQNTRSQELHSLYKERASLLDKVAGILIESDLTEGAEADQAEDWEKAPVRNPQKLIGLHDKIRKLDTKIAVYELAIPQQIDELEDLEEQIQETIELADQLLLLQESNQALIRQFDN